ncbi:MAG: radical SAM protein, partial [Tepidanaerobacteraceae bacterium]
MDLAHTYLGEKVISQGVKYLLSKDMDDIDKLIGWAEKLPMPKNQREYLENAKIFLEDKNSNWYQLGQRLLSETDPYVKEKIGMNFFVNANFLGVPRQHKMAQELGYSIPWAILIDPTERCNLNCTGCWAGDYQRHEELDFDTLDRVMTEGEELGIYCTIMSGGEPTIRKKDIIKLAEKHSSQLILLFTNGTLVD